MVSEHALASAAGALILERGGNAADAAVATAFALAVVLPQAGNLGGGGFALWVDASGTASCLDFRETAPAGADARFFLDAQGEAHSQRLRASPLSIGVPGTPLGLWHLYREHGSGSLSWRALLEPAIALARDGFEVDLHLERALSDEADWARLERSSGARALFAPRGERLAQGARLSNPDLAATLEAIARDGPNGFYRGAVAEAVARELDLVCAEAGVARQAAPTLEDLAAYEVRSRTALASWFGGHEIVSVPPPSSGGVILLQVLAILDGFPLHAQRTAALAERARAGASAVECDEVGIDARIANWWIEALRSAFRARASELGDPDFVSVDVAALLSNRWIAEHRVSIGESASREPPPSLNAIEGDDTTHLCTLDREGNAVSLTTTLNSRFGSGILVRGAGFLLNDELDDFALPGGAPNQFALSGGSKNALEANKRPLSSMTPCVVRADDGSVRMILGGAGGPRIPSSVLGVLLRTLVFEQDLAHAVAASRLHQQAQPEASAFEPGWPEGLLAALARRGHQIERSAAPFGAVQAIRVLQSGAVEVASDPRRGGAGILVRGAARR